MGDETRALSFNLFRKKNLMPVPSPIDEASDTLAVFDVCPSGAEDERGFFFGLATAPAHVKDRFHDAWLEFAERSPCDKSKSEHHLQPADALLGPATGDGWE